MFPVISSNIAGIDHDPRTNTLTVYFNSGAIWAYSGVPETVYQDFRTANSPGTYYVTYIKGTYPAQEIAPPRKKQAGSVPDVKDIPPPPGP
jgi:hypothetical protein